jgi:RHS repeat-associated protein
MNDPDMGIWYYEYDNIGNLIKQTDAKGQVLTFSYDSLTRLICKQSSGQVLASYVYDDVAKNYCVGRLSKITDQSGSTEFYYDNLGRETKSVKTVNGYGAYSVERTYDALGRLLTLKYPDAEIVSYSYNPQGVSSVANYITDIDYSVTGQIAKIKYSNGVETNYAYDPNTLRLSNINSVSPLGKIQDLSYQFDNVGNIKNLSDYVNTASQSFNYDDLDRLVTAAGNYGTFTYSYDSIGNMTSKEGVSLTYGKNGLLPHAVTGYGSTSIEYDANGNMTKKGTVQLTYDAENRLTKSENVSATPVAQSATVSLSLNPGWNFVSFPVSFVDNKIASVLSGISGKYDQVSRYNPVTKKYENYVGNSKFDQFTTFDFGKGYQIYITSSDSVNLTVSGSLPISQNVALSSGYNLIFSSKKDETPVETALSPLKLGVNYSKVLYYNKTSGIYQEYSASKKDFTTLKPGVAYYLYCASSATWAVSNPCVTTNTTFVYDGDGGRIKKSASSGSTVYIGSLFEIDSSGKTTKHIFSGSNRICAVESTGSKFYYHSDHLGSSNVATDATGKQVGFTEFTPYGSVYRQSGTHDPKYKFTGKELDSCGLYFYGARYYDAQLGRFVTADTIVQAPYDPQSLNRYSYCRNNPINYVDPSGHSWFSKFWGAIVGVVAGIVGTVLSGGNMMVGFQIFNFFSSLGSAVKTGNWGGFAGGLAGGVLGGWAGGALGDKFAGFLGKKAFSFGGGFLVGATEMGVGGFGGSFGGALGSGESFGDAMKAGGIGFGIGAAVGGLIEGSYYGMQNFAHGMSREQVYQAGIRRLHALSVNRADKTTAIVGSRPLGPPDKPGLFRHRYVRGEVDHFEMGPDAHTKLIELNGEGSFGRTSVYISKYPQLTLESNVSVSQAGYNNSVNLYKAAWVGTPYSFYNCNSNFAVNTVIYGAGGNAPENLGTTPIGIDHYAH